MIELHTNWPKFKHPKSRREAHPLWTFTILASPLALNRSSLQNLTRPHPKTTEELTPPPVCPQKYCSTVAQQKWEQGGDTSCPLTACTLVPWRSRRKPHCYLSVGGKEERFKKQAKAGGMSWLQKWSKVAAHRLEKNTPPASNKVTTPIFSKAGKALPPTAKGNSQCFLLPLLGPGSQGCCRPSTAQP